MNKIYYNVYKQQTNIYYANGLFKMRTSWIDIFAHLRLYYY